MIATVRPSVPAGILRLLRARMAVMQEFGKLLAQVFVALAVVTDHDRVLEQLFLNRRGSSAQR